MDGNIGQFQELGIAQYRETQRLIEEVVQASRDQILNATRRV